MSVNICRATNVKFLTNVFTSLVDLRGTVSDTVSWHVYSTPWCSRPGTNEEIDHDRGAQNVGRRGKGMGDDEELLGSYVRSAGEVEDATYEGNDRYFLKEQPGRSQLAMALCRRILGTNA